MSNFRGNTLYDILKDNQIENGYHDLIANEVTLNAEVINFAEDVILTSSPVWGDNADDTTMLVLIFHQNLTIETDTTIIPCARKKGMTIYIKGALKNNGTISMSARGANAAGQDVYLFKNQLGFYEYVPANGAAGGADARTTGDYGLNLSPSGADGTKRRTGGGGTGGMCYTNYGSGSNYGAGGAGGTSYSGGAGGGGSNHAFGTNAGRGNVNGGAGGALYSVNGGNLATQGAGNPGSNSGTGGLLIIYADSIINNGSILAQGVSALASHASGGASGGGSINIFYNISCENTGDINASGGAGAASTWGTSYYRYNVSGNGGNGAVTIQSFQEVIALDFPKKILEYTYTGNYQEIALHRGKYLIECFGAQGSKDGQYNAYGGKGGYSKGVLTLKSNFLAYAYVGEQDANTTGADRIGWNGGGIGGWGDRGQWQGGPGGGATDIRLVPGNWDNAASLRSRIMVAGGGGGGSCYFSGASDGGAGGGLMGGESTCQNGTIIENPARGGTQTAGGIAAPNGYNGSFGKGGNRDDRGGGYGGSGGGGYYGGGGGDDHFTVLGETMTGGGGGSGFISGMDGCDAVDENGNHTGQPNHYSQIIFTDCEMQTGVNEGSGLIRITFQPKIFLTEVDLSPVIIHKGSIYYSAKIKTKEGVKVTSYALIINTNIYATEIVPKENKISFSLPYSAFKTGSNDLKLVIYDENNILDMLSYEITVNNKEPEIEIELNQNNYQVGITDADGDEIEYSFALNNTVYYSAKSPATVNIQGVLPHHLLNNTANIFTVTATDPFGALTSKSVNFAHALHGLIFVDAAALPYTDCGGHVIKQLPIEPMFAGQTSLAASVFLKNLTQEKLSNISVWSKELPPLTECILSLDEDMTDASEVLALTTPLEPNAEIEIFIQIKSAVDTPEGGIIKLFAHGEAAPTEN